MSETIIYDRVAQSLDYDIVCQTLFATYVVTALAITNTRMKYFEYCRSMLNVTSLWQTSGSRYGCSMAGDQKPNQLLREIKLSKHTPHAGKNQVYAENSQMHFYTPTLQSKVNFAQCALQYDKNTSFYAHLNLENLNFHVIWKLRFPSST